MANFRKSDLGIVLSKNSPNIPYLMSADNCLFNPTKKAPNKIEIVLDITTKSKVS